MRPGCSLVIVVIQLVLTLRVHAFRTLSLIPLLRGPHGTIVGAGRLDGRE